MVGNCLFKMGAGVFVCQIPLRDTTAYVYIYIILCINTIFGCFEVGTIFFGARTCSSSSGIQMLRATVGGFIGFFLPLNLWGKRSSS